MATYNKFYSFSTDLADGSHNFKATGGHVYKLMLTNSLPVATNTVKADLTEIAAGNGYTAGGEVLTISRSNTTGTEKIIVSADITWTAVTGSMATFQYVVIYNDTQTSPAKPLVGWIAYPSPITMLVGESFLADFDQINGLFTVE